MKLIVDCSGRDVLLIYDRKYLKVSVVYFIIVLIVQGIRAFHRSGHPDRDLWFGCFSEPVMLAKYT
jgi:hypothetical protein